MRSAVSCEVANDDGRLCTGMSGFGRIFQGHRTLGSVMLAKSFGIESGYVEEPAEIRPALEKALAATGPYLLEVRTRGDVPMPRTGYWDIADFLKLGND